MRRAALALALAVALARPAAAQRILFQIDSAAGAVPGTTLDLPVRTDGYYGYVQQARVSVFYDPAQVTVIGAVAVYPELATNLQVTFPAPGRVDVRGEGGFASASTPLFRLQVQLVSGSSTGSWLWARPDSLFFYTYGERAREIGTDIGQVCHATTPVGDVDNDGSVDSRDALITLSASVGLPVTGFQLANGDADGDGLANSRDALMILSYSIGLSTGQTTRLGSGIPDACPGLSPPGETLVARQGSYGDTLVVLAAAATVPVVVPNVVSLSFGEEGQPRLAANGTSIAYGCYDLNGPAICRIETDGTGFQQLTSGTGRGRYPDWDPAGLKVAYATSSSPSPGQVRHLDADGTDDSLVTPSIPCCASVHAVWNRIGTRLAWAQTGPSGLYTVNRNGSGLTLVSITPATVTGLSYVRWNAAGDSIAFTSSYGPGIWAAPAAGGVTTRVAPFTSIDRTFDWGAPGVAFWRGGLWLLTPTGILRRLTAVNYYQPAFRRNP